MRRPRIALLVLAYLLPAIVLTEEGNAVPPPAPEAADARGNGPGIPALTPYLGKVKLKHDNMIIAAAFAPDGKTAASGGWDNLVRHWDVATGKELRRFAGHTKAVYGLAFSPDGKRLASCSEDRTLRLWDIASGKELCKCEGHTAGVTRVAFTPDGRQLATSSYDQTVRVWEVATGKERQSFGGQQSGFTAVSISPDGRYLASGAADFSVRLLELSAGKEERRFRGHSSSIIGIAFTPDGRLLATASEDSTVRLWQVASGKLVRQLSGHGNGVWAVAFSPDGRYLASAGRDKRLRIWEVVSGGLVRVVEGHSDGIPALDFSPDGRLLLSGSHDTTAVLWDWSAGKPDGPQETVLDDEKLLACWTALAGPDALTAQRSTWRLAAAPQQAVPFLRQRLRPAEGLDDQRLTRLIADLDSNVFVVRQRATKDLQDLGEQAETALRQVLASKPSLEVRQRVERLLEKIDSSTLQPEVLQTLRAIESLERAGTPEARQTVEALARGAPGMRPTEDAKQALQRWPAVASKP